MKTRPSVLTLIFTTVVLCIVSIASSAFAAPGALDSGFGSSGVAATNVLLNQNEGITGVAEQSDGKLIAVGFIMSPGAQDGFIARYLANGTLDPSFGTAGVVTFDNPSDSARNLFVNDVAVDADDNIYVAMGANTAVNEHNQLVGKYSPNGTPDATYGTAGIVTISYHLAGNFVESATALLLDPSDGSLYVGGKTLTTGDDTAHITKLDSTGAEVGAFGTAGRITMDWVVSNDDPEEIIEFEIDNAGRLVVGGAISPGAGGRGFFARLNRTTGALDTTFDTDGMHTFFVGENSMDDFGGFVVLADNSLIAVGRMVGGTETGFADDSMWAKAFQANGSVRAGFGTAGEVQRAISPKEIGNVHGAALDAYGRVVVGLQTYGAGVQAIGATRFAADTGALDTDFGTNGYATVTPLAEASATLGLYRQDDGNVVVFGRRTTFFDQWSTLARFIADDEGPAPADTTPPLAPFIISSPAASTTSTDATITFTGPVDAASYLCKLDLAAWAACTSPVSFSGLALGQHTFSVKALDAAANASDPATATWTISSPSSTETPNPTVTPPVNPPAGQVTLPAGKAAKLGAIAKSGVLGIQLPRSIAPGTIVKADLSITAKQAKALGMRVKKGTKTVVIGTGTTTAPGTRATNKFTLNLKLTKAAKSAIARAARKGSKVKSVKSTLKLVLTKDKVSAKPLSKSFTLKR